MEKLVSREVSQKQAARILKITDRQIRNRLKHYKQEGAKGFVHRNRGRPSKRRLKVEDLEKILELLRTIFAGC